MVESKDPESTKICSTCKTTIPVGAKKCPNCHSDLRSWFRRHPILSCLLILFGFPFVMAALLGGGSGSSQTSEPKKEVVSPTKQVAKTPSQVTEDLSNILNEANQKIGFQFYKKVRIEGDDPYWAIFTISDDWYNLEPYVQERLVKIAVNYYKEVEGGLNSLAEVYLEDSFRKEVAKGYYGSGGIRVEIAK